MELTTVQVTVAIAICMVVTLIPIRSTKAAGLNVYENEKSIFFYNHTNGQMPEEPFLKTRGFSNVLFTGDQAIITTEALRGITESTINNLDNWQRNSMSDNESK